MIDGHGVEVSYAELARRADAFAAAVGTQPHLLLLSMNNEIDAVIAYLGALRGGHPVILTGDADTAATTRLTAMFEPDVQCVGTTIVSRMKQDGKALHHDLAVLLSTSGSTGSVKLVRVSSTALDANARSIAEYLEIAADDRALTSLPLTYSYGLSVLNSHLAAGAAVVLTGRSVIDHEFWRLAEASAATSLAGVPYTYELLEKTGFRNLELPALRTLTQAGGRLPAELVATYADWASTTGRRFFTMYGQTEATARIAYLGPAEMHDYPGCIGRAVPGGTLRLRAVDGQPEDVGELIYRGPNVMMGYATRRDDLARGAELEELATGDLASEVAPDVFRIVGRLGRFAKIAGLRIGFDDIESLLLEHGIAAKVAGDDTIVAVATCDADLAAAQALVAARCAIPAAALAFVAVSEWPRLVSGKIDYAALTALGRAEQVAAAAAQTVSAGSLHFAPAFAPLLRGRSASPDDSFMTLAGDSLSYVQVSIAIERQLGSLPMGWESLTLAELDAMLPFAVQRTSNTRIVAGEMLVRVAAIGTVVVGHIGDITAVKGGGAALLMTAGYNLARFQSQRLAGEDRWQIIATFLKRVILPAYLMILLIAGLSKSADLSLPTLLLVSNYFGEQRGPLLPFWFIETLLQAMVLTVALFSVAPLRRWAIAHAWEAGLAFVGLSMAAKMLVPMLFTISQIAGGDRTLDAWAYAFALGLLLAAARTLTQRVFAVTLAGVLAAFDWELIDPHTAWLTAAAAIILFLPRVPIWTPLARIIAFLAQISFYIYITHMLAIQIVRWHLHLSSPALALALSIVFGAGLYVVWSAALHYARRHLRAPSRASGR